MNSCGNGQYLNANGLCGKNNIKFIKLFYA